MMIKSLLKPFFLFLTLIFCANPIMAQTETAGVQTETLRVGIAGSKPFVFDESKTGISLDIWEKIAKKKSWSYEYVSFKNVNDALSKGNVDLVVGPISITARRLESMQFSQPFYNSSISIISRIDNHSIWQTIKPLFSIKLLMAVGIFLLILAIVGSFLWLAEHKKSPEQFPHDPLKGIGAGMWLAIVTMSTTGYGDKAPVTLMGRIITGLWIVISIIFATSMVAGIASTLTLSTIGSTTVSSIEQLSGRKAATISGSPSEEFLSKTKAKVISVNNLDEAIEKLESNDVDAVIFDRPQLLYFLKDNKKENLYISKAEYYKQGYGFAFPVNSRFILDVNRTLLELAENQEIEKIIHTYIQKDE
ncbi:MAG: transporter substrate-binding domain-containing protein [Candidatus Scalindua rubra]|uniref:Glutamine-binding periplasmic protein n=1 Tax=Candidatus Scalindua brodae TaxID=237368 RepID=A0A0B0EMN7_9BACT|nr:MAG: Glutamine-binding periplasmic protein precursor [Candidatus Scalindua brodae]MBZ0110336.1 transporter substrate-binding domain-containing protein [Candidatus Scalindua rubra]TWU30635.1 Glutamine-binding periplasmic protein precursor [Candidatus Brocadiaceae bacterium S225]